MLQHSGAERLWLTSWLKARGAALGPLIAGLGVGDGSAAVLARLVVFSRPASNPVARAWRQHWDLGEA